MPVFDPKQFTTQPLDFANQIAETERRHSLDSRQALTQLRQFQFQKDQFEYQQQRDVDEREFRSEEAATQRSWQNDQNALNQAAAHERAQLNAVSQMNLQTVKGEQSMEKQELKGDQRTKEQMVEFLLRDRQEGARVGGGRGGSRKEDEDFAIEYLRLDGLKPAREGMPGGGSRGSTKYASNISKRILTMHKLRLEAGYYKDKDLNKADKIRETVRDAIGEDLDLFAGKDFTSGRVEALVGHLSDISNAVAEGDSDAVAAARRQMIKEMDDGGNNIASSLIKGIMDGGLELYRDKLGKLRLEIRHHGKSSMVELGQKIFNNPMGKEIADQFHSAFSDEQLEAFEEFLSTDVGGMTAREALRRARRGK